MPYISARISPNAPDITSREVPFQLLLGGCCDTGKCSPRHCRDDVVGADEGGEVGSDILHEFAGRQVMGSIRRRMPVLGRLLPRYGGQQKQVW
jgi:hypothetical protein